MFTMHNLSDKSGDGWFDERVELYVDGELVDDERTIFVERLRTDAALRGQVALAQQITRTLATKQAGTCDETLTQRLAAIRTGSDDDVRPDTMRAIRPLAVAWSNRERRAAFGAVLRWPVGIAAAIALTALFLRIPGLQPHTEPIEVFGAEQTYSPEEIEEALREAKFALAIVGDAGRRAGDTVRETVIERNVIRPVNRAFENTVYGPTAHKN
jgi:hypothetical protein